MTPRVFGVDYQFLSCGDVFTQGLAHAAADLGIAYEHADWSDPNLALKSSAFRPDLVFVVHGRRISQQRLGNPSIATRTAVWLLDEPYEVDNTAAFSHRFDYQFVSDPVTLHRHPRAAYLPVCYDPHVHYADDSPRWRRVGFIGGGNPTRDRYLSALATADRLDYVVGGAWHAPDVQARCLSGNITPAMTAALYRQTRIVVNIFRDRHHFNAQGTPATSLNPRVYEALACGALVVSEWRPEIETLVPELPTFRTEAECVALVGDLLADPVAAEAIRVQTSARLAGHTYAARLQTVLATVGSAVAA